VLLLLLLAGDVDAAERALADGKAEEAIHLLGDAADADDAPVRVLAVLGRARLRLGDAEGAVDPLLRASDAQPDDRAVARDAARACLAAAEGPLARAYLEDARRLAGRAGDGLLAADVEFALGNLEEAVRAYRAAEPPEGDRLRVLRNVAAALEGLGRTEEAKAAHGEALEEALRRGDLEAAFQSAFSGGRGGRLLAWLDERIAEHPTLETLWYRGYARERLLLHEGAAEDLREVLRLRPDDAVAKAMLVSVLVRLGAAEQRPAALEEAERLGREVLERDPAAADVFENMMWLALYAWQNRDVSHACALSEFLHGVDPSNVRAGTNFANMARRLGRHADAQAVYEALLLEDPSDVEVLNDHGILRDGVGDEAGAIRLWERVLEEDPREGNALENLFTKAWERGDAAAAEAVLARGLEAARASGDARLLDRWRWFRDRRIWAPSGFGG
jgi:tetratricopeptide (TPR) repeat protein